MYLIACWGLSGRYINGKTFYCNTLYILLTLTTLFLPVKKKRGVILDKTGQESL